MKKVETVNPGEILAARCTYNTTGHHTATRIGPAGGDEMCNLYLMFYTLSSNDDFIVCADEQNPGLTSKLPEGSDVPLPPNPALEHKASGTENNAIDYNNGKVDEDTIPNPVKKGESSVRKRPGVDTGSVRKKPGVEPNYGDYGYITNDNTVVDYATNNPDLGEGNNVDNNSDDTNSDNPDSLSTDYGMQPRAAAYTDYQQGLVIYLVYIQRRGSL